VDTWEWLRGIDRRFVRLTLETDAMIAASGIAAQRSRRMTAQSRLEALDLRLMTDVARWQTEESGKAFGRFLWDGCGVP
jgi:hypothetical protein